MGDTAALIERVRNLSQTREIARAASLALIDNPPSAILNKIRKEKCLDLNRIQGMVSEAIQKLRIQKFHPPSGELIITDDIEDLFWGDDDVRDWERELYHRNPEEFSQYLDERTKEVDQFAEEEYLASHKAPIVSVISDAILQFLIDELASSTLRDTEPGRPRLELDEGRKRLRIDNIWHDYTGERASYYLSVLLKAKGNWESGSNLVSASASRADRVYKGLPAAIKKIIQSKRGGTGGYRIIPEFFDLT
ncbi:MAG: hypothetical protein JXP48_13135 [Acidobacteria bacterium]|nr:hypothetical protein [Acidobacteriota bacterium]